MLYSIVLNIYNNYIHNNNIFFSQKIKLNDINEIQDKLEKGLLYNNNKLMI